jgi:hypothetical protein
LLDEAGRTDEALAALEHAATRARNVHEAAQVRARLARIRRDRI